jgi:hypothetical protein
VQARLPDHEIKRIELYAQLEGVQVETTRRRKLSGWEGGHAPALLFSAKDISRPLSTIPHAMIRSRIRPFR